jgi:hypothetical protein
MKITNKKWLLYGCLAAVVLLVLLIVEAIIAPSNARRALPASATDVQEYYLNAGFTGDFTRILKARLPEKDFPLYAKNLGLTERYDPSKQSRDYGGLETSIGGMPEWWDEPLELDNCYFLLGKEYVERIKWKDGWVYYVASQS